MKKLGMLVAVAVLLGGVSVAFAQGSPSVDAKTMGYAWAGAGNTHTGNNVQQQVNETALVSNILEKGEVTAISYTLVGHVLTPCSYGGTGSCSYTKPYSKNGSVGGREYIQGNKSYILLSRKLWDSIAEECVPGRVTRALGTNIVSQTIKTDKHEHVKTGSGLLNTKNYTVNGREYTLITFNNK